MRLCQSVIGGAVAVLLGMGAAAALAQTSPAGAVPSESEISRSLAPQTRGSSAPPQTPAPLTRGLPVMGAPPPVPVNPALGPAATGPSASIGATAAHPSATFNTIQFEFGSAKLAPNSVATLKNLGNALNHALADQQHFRIEGHTDARGAASYNDALSKERAQAVVDYLVKEMGVADTRLQAVGKGSSEPVGGADPYAPVNRRVVIVNLEG